jgi:hypothetical protein
LSIDNFYKDRSRNDGLSFYCKSCDKLKRQKHYRHNADQEKQSRQNYYQSNKDSIIQKSVEYAKNKRNTNDLFKLKDNIRRSIRASISQFGDKKSNTSKILGCTFNEFKEHIEIQFSDGMSWENRNEWHLDHIIPVSFAQSEKEIILLNHYTNFRPLWSTENIIKSNKLTNEALCHPIYKQIIDNR